MLGQGCYVALILSFGKMKRRVELNLNFAFLETGTLSQMQKAFVITS